MRYVAMWNMSGCLPEMEPAEFDTFEEARDYIAKEIESVADDLMLYALITDTPCPADKEATQAARAVSWVRRQKAPFTCGTISGYEYSVEAIKEKPVTSDALLREAIDAWPQFDNDEEVSGADMVEWFADWRERAKLSLESKK